MRLASHMGLAPSDAGGRCRRISISRLRRSRVTSRVNVPQRPIGTLARHNTSVYSIVAMAERAAKRTRRISTEYDESEGDGWDGRANSRYVADGAMHSLRGEDSSRREHSRPHRALSFRLSPPSLSHRPAHTHPPLRWATGTDGGAILRCCNPSHLPCLTYSTPLF